MKVIGYRVIIMLRNGHFLPVCKPTETEAVDLLVWVFRCVKHPWDRWGMGRIDWKDRPSAFFWFRDVVSAYYTEILEDPHQVVAEAVRKHVDGDTPGEGWRSGRPD